MMKELLGNFHCLHGNQGGGYGAVDEFFSFGFSVNERIRHITTPFHIL